MADDEKKHLIEYNKMKETTCSVEGKSESTCVRSQRRHYPQSNRTSIENYQEEKQDPDSDKPSWETSLPTPHGEKRHFPEKNNAIFG